MCSVTSTKNKQSWNAMASIHSGRELDVLAYRVQIVNRDSYVYKVFAPNYQTCKIRYEKWHKLHQRTRRSRIKRYVQVDLNAVCPGVELWEMSELLREKVKATVEFV